MKQHSAQDRVNRMLAALVNATLAGAQSLRSRCALDTMHAPPCELVVRITMVVPD